MSSPNKTDAHASSPNITTYLLNEIGTPQQIANELRCTTSAIYNWMDRNTIPAEKAWLLANSELCIKRSGISVELLLWYVNAWKVEEEFKAFVFRLGRGSKAKRALAKKFSRERQLTIAKRMEGSI